MTVKLLTEQRLEFLSLKGGCADASESTLVKMPHCCKSHVAAHIQSVLKRAKWFWYEPSCISKLCVGQNC